MLLWPSSRQSWSFGLWALSGSAFSPITSGARVKEQTGEQKPLDESHQKFIQDMEYLEGRKLTRQEINHAIYQAEQIGDL
jgi:hypothetical protein